MDPNELPTQYGDIASFLLKQLGPQVNPQDRINLDPTLNFNPSAGPAQSMAAMAPMGNGMTPDDIAALQAQIDGHIAKGQAAQKQVFDVQDARPGMTDSQIGLGAIVTLLAALMGDKKGEAGGAFVQGMTGAANQQYQRKQQGVDKQRAMLNLQSQQEMQLAELLLGKKRELTTERTREMDRADDWKRFNLTQQASKDALALREKGDFEQNLWTNYRTAVTPGAIRIAAQRMRNAGLVDAPTEADVQADIDKRLAPDRFRASNDYRQEITARLNHFGEIDESKAADLEKRRTFLLSTYFDGDEDALPPVPKGKTLKAKAAEDRKTQWAERLGFMNSKQRDDLAVRRGTLDINRQRLTYAAQNANSTSRNATIRELEFEFKKHKAEAKSFDADIDKAIIGKGGIDQKIAGLTKQAETLRKAQNMMKASEVDAQIAKLNAEKDYLLSQKEGVEWNPFAQFGLPDPFKLAEGAQKQAAGQATARKSGAVKVGATTYKYEIRP